MLPDDGQPSMGMLLDTAGKTARRFSAHALDFLFPRFCPVCNAKSDREGRHLCSSCLANIDLYSGAVCSRCGAMPDGAVGRDYLCSDCRDVLPSFDMARSAAHFAGPVREMILSLKYGNASWLCDDLIDLLEGCVRAHFDFGAIDAIVPVPLHPARLRKRKYNQSALLAEELASRIGTDYHPEILRRNRATATQTRLGATRRRLNVKGAFSVAHPEWAEGRTVMVIDDVMTTGATLGECARVLKSAGAVRVWCATVARD